MNKVDPYPIRTNNVRDLSWRPESMVAYIQTVYNRTSVSGDFHSMRTALYANKPSGLLDKASLLWNLGGYRDLGS